MNILFLCAENSCRSIMAEALFRAAAPAGVSVQSAGSRPLGIVHPRALEALNEAGIATDGLYSKSWDNLPEKPDAAVALCADIAGEACPLYFGKVARSHWAMPDPALTRGGEKIVRAAFSQTVAVLQRRINTLAELLEAEPAMDASRLQAVLDSIAAL